MEHNSQHAVPEDKIVDAVTTTTGLVSVEEQRDAKDDGVSMRERQLVLKTIHDSATQVRCFALFLVVSLVLCETLH